MLPGPLGARLDRPAAACNDPVSSQGPITMTRDRYAVIGHPVDHSLSPRIHTRFAEQTGEALVYERLAAPIDGFAATATQFLAEGGRGLNVTVPFKAEAFAWADTATAAARVAGVANTLSLQANGWVEAHNSDGIGLVRDLEANLGVAVAGTHILLIGAGGAARGVLGPLLDARPARLTVTNRTFDKADQLANAFAEAGPVAARGLDALDTDGGYDRIINATAASLEGALAPIPGQALAAGGAVYDLMYGEPAAAFLDWGRGAGAGVAADGLGMLVEQAAEAFAHWRGPRPDTAAVLAELRSEAGT
jgi:shikimate dehydrogenase